MLVEPLAGDAREHNLNPAGPSSTAGQPDGSRHPGLTEANFFKTGLELGHWLRILADGPCGCDLCLRCPKFFTTSEYVPRLRDRLQAGQQLIQDATERGWPREAERHTAISGHICELLTELGEPARPRAGEQ